MSVTGTTVLLRFQLTELTEADETDMDDIVSELEALVGDHVQVGKTVEICSERHTCRRTGPCDTSSLLGTLSSGLASRSSTTSHTDVRSTQGARAADLTGRQPTGIGQSERCSITVVPEVPNLGSLP